MVLRTISECKINAAMPDPVPIYRPSDCYTLSQMIARYVPHAEMHTAKGRHRAQRVILFARQNKALPHVVFGTRTIMYPKALTDRWLAANQRNCQ